MHLPLREAIRKADYKAVQALLNDKSLKLDLDEVYLYGAGLHFEKPLMIPGHIQIKIWQKPNAPTGYLYEAVCRIGAICDAKTLAFSLNDAVFFKKLGQYYRIVYALIQHQASHYFLGHPILFNLHNHTRRLVLEPAAASLNEELKIITQLFLRQGFDVNQSLCFKEIGMTPANLLVLTLREDALQIDYLKIFLAFGFKVDTYIYRGLTPLMLAILNAQDEAARLLLDHGANIYQTVDMRTTHFDEPLYLRPVQAHEMLGIDLLDKNWAKTSVITRKKKTGADHDRRQTALQELLDAELALGRASQHHLNYAARIEAAFVIHLQKNRLLDLDFLISLIVPESLKTAFLLRLGSDGLKLLKDKLAMQLVIQGMSKRTFSSSVLNLIQEFHNSKTQSVQLRQEIDKGQFFIYQKLKPMPESVPTSAISRLKRNG